LFELPFFLLLRGVTLVGDQAPLPVVLTIVSFFPERLAAHELNVPDQPSGLRPEIFRKSTAS